VIRFSAQAYSFAKDPVLPLEWEDSAAYSVGSGRFAVADGATQAFRSGEWAQMLTQAYMQRFPAADGLPSSPRQKVIREWFGDQVRIWHDNSPVSTTFWAQDAEQENPPSATFAGLLLTPHDGAASWEATAIGDCCVFQIRGGRCEKSFPLTSASEFGKSPHLLTTAVGRLEGSLDKLRTCTGDARPGDIFVLASDAFSEWLLGLHKYDQEIWGRLGFFGHQNFRQMMTELRDAHAIETDDVSVLVVVIDGPLTRQTLDGGAP
jgi:serine/threonine protein phosphatase PrpC